MRLSRKSEYACLALIDLAQHCGERYIRTADISTRKKIPRKYLEQILLILKRGGYVRSARGADGGYMLAKDPAKVSVAEILRLMDGPLAPVQSVSRYFYERTPIAGQRRLLGVLRDIRDHIARTLEQTTFADIA